MDTLCTTMNLADWQLVASGVKCWPLLFVALGIACALEAATSRAPRVARAAGLSLSVVAAVGIGLAVIHHKRRAAR